MSEEKSGSGFFKGFVFGGLVGAVIALLYAPKKGEELRKEIKVKSDELRGDAKEFYEEAKTFSEEKLAEAIKKAEQLKDEAEKKFEEAKQKYEQVIAEARKAAEDLKKKVTLEESGEKTTPSEKTRKKGRGKIAEAIDASKKAFEEEMKKSKS